MSKNLFLVFLGAFTAWLVICLITGNYNFQQLFIFIIGASIGYQTGKKEKEKDV